MTLDVEFQFLLILERSPAHLTRERFFPGVCPPDVTVVGGVRGEGLPAVFTLERPLSGVLPNMSAENTGGCEGLQRQKQNKKQNTFI